ncbi:MAG: carbon storage regulator [Tepidisphaeraceae bacterium]
MLVLSRRSCESVVVGDPAGQVEQMLKVTVLEIAKGRVRLGFEVAGDVPIHRWEVWHRIRSNIPVPPNAGDHAQFGHGHDSENQLRLLSCAQLK